MDIDFSIYFLKYFPALFISFLLFVFVVFVFETQPVMVAEPYLVVSLEGRVSYGLCAFYPGPWLGDPIEKKKHPGKSS